MEKPPRKSLLGPIFIGVLLVGLVVYCLLISEKQTHSPSGPLQCQINARDIALALLNYETARGEFPPANVCDENGRPLYSWRVLVLPYLEQNAMYNNFHRDEPWDSPHNLQFLKHCPRIFHCPATPLNPKQGETSYAMIVGPDTISSGPKSISVNDITKPQESMILIVETNRKIPWTAPGDIPLESLRYGLLKPTAENENVPGIAARHNGGSVAAFADGSVRYLDPNTTSEMLLKWATMEKQER